MRVYKARRAMTAKKYRRISPDSDSDRVIDFILETFEFSSLFVRPPFPPVTFSLVSRSATPWTVCLVAPSLGVSPTAASVLCIDSALFEPHVISRTRIAVLPDS